MQFDFKYGMKFGSSLSVVSMVYMLSEFVAGTAEQTHQSLDPESQWNRGQDGDEQNQRILRKVWQSGLGRLRIWR